MNKMTSAQKRQEMHIEFLTQIAMHLGDPSPATRANAVRMCGTLFSHDIDTLTEARKTMAYLMLRLSVLAIGSDHA